MSYKGKRIGVIVPTLNNEKRMRLWIDALLMQTILPDRILVIDSSPDDKTTNIIREFKQIEVIKIDCNEFNHGGTRQRAVEFLSDIDIIIFLTQDAILADEYSLEYLMDVFKNEKIAVAYGRQLPHANANPIAAHARLFNYSSSSLIKSINDINKLGIKTIFISNSFAAYRKSSLNSIGGFPNEVILSEDTYVAAKLILNNWEIAYCADAKVYHSHNYSSLEEFKRYFDIGVFHNRERWIIKEFGKAEGEGRKFVLSEIKYLIKSGRYHLLISIVLRNLVKYIGYKLGMKESFISKKIKFFLSGNKKYWI